MQNLSVPAVVVNDKVDSDGQEIADKRPRRPKSPKIETVPQLMAAIDDALQFRAGLNIHELSALFPEHYRHGGFVAEIAAIDGTFYLKRGLTRKGVDALDRLHSRYLKYAIPHQRRGHWTSPHRLPTVLDICEDEPAALKLLMVMGEWSDFHEIKKD